MSGSSLIRGRVFDESVKRHSFLVGHVIDLCYSNNVCSFRFLLSPAMTINFILSCFSNYFCRTHPQATMLRKSKMKRRNTEPVLPTSMDRPSMIAPDKPSISEEKQS
jgi:hypothetical protein